MSIYHENVSLRLCVHVCVQRLSWATFQYLPQVGPVLKSAAVTLKYQIFMHQPLQSLITGVLKIDLNCTGC